MPLIIGQNPGNTPAGGDATGTVSNLRVVSALAGVIAFVLAAGAAVISATTPGQTLAISGGGAVRAPDGAIIDAGGVVSLDYEDAAVLVVGPGNQVVPGSDNAVAVGSQADRFTSEWLSTALNVYGDAAVNVALSPSGMTYAGQAVVGTLVGSYTINGHAGVLLQWDGGTVALVSSAKEFAPGADNTISSGDILNRWSTVYGNTLEAGDGSVNNILSGFNLTCSVADPSCGITQTGPTNDIATTDMSFTTQPPFGDAAVNVLGGSFDVMLPVPISGTAESALKIFRGATLIGTIQTLPGFSTYSALFLTPGIVPSLSNYTLIAQAGTTALNSTSALNFRIANSTVMTFGTSNAQFLMPALTWGSTQSAPSLEQLVPANQTAANGTNGQTVTVASQPGGPTSQGDAGTLAGNAGTLQLGGLSGGAATGSTFGTGGTGENVAIVTGAGGAGPSDAGVSGAWNVEIGGTSNTILQVGPLGWGWKQHAITLSTSGTTTLAAADYVFHYLQPATVTLSNNATMALPNPVSGYTSEYILDVSKVTFSGHTLTVSCGSGNAANTISAITQVIWRVYCTGANTAYIQ